MEFIKRIPSLIGLFLAGFNAAIFIVIKFNDLKHLESSISEIKSMIRDYGKKLDNNVERIAKIEGTCSANHPK